MLKVDNVSVDYAVAAPGGWPWTAKRTLAAVSGVSFEIGERETLGLVGESGSGKSTLAKAIVGTVAVSSGRILWDGEDLTGMDRRARRAVRKEMPMIFQNPLGALNPRMTVGQIIAEPLRTYRRGLSKSEIAAKVGQLMERVGLQPGLSNRYPHEFSGGQCQRIAIARALILNPRLVICDEPVAALDVSIRAQVVNLLQELQKDFGLSMIFIAHDLSVIRHLSTRIMVMYFGKVMELAPARSLIERPLHPYTRSLIASVPVPDPAEERRRSKTILRGELPSPTETIDGCVFESRCPEARDDCKRIIPELKAYEPQHDAACPYQS